MLGASSVIVDDQGRVLLVRHGYGELNWELPGGAGEPGESLEGTARREAREEIGVDLDVAGLTGMYWEPENSAHHFVFRARAIGRPRVADVTEITDLGWFSPDDLPRPISDFTVQRIADALQDRAVAFRVIGPRVWLR